MRHIAGANRIRVNPETIDVTKFASTPYDATLLRSFSGLACKCVRYIKTFPQIAAVLHHNNSKSTRFKWNEKMEATFEKLKKPHKPPVLSFTGFEKLFVLKTDDSSMEVGAVLSHEKLTGKYILPPSQAEE